MSALDAHKLALEVEAAQDVDLERVVPVLHGWIQRQETDGLAIDVASYAHVPGGPGVLLIGHGVDLAVRAEAGRAVLHVALKRDPRPGEEKLADLAARVTAAAARLERDLGLRFGTERIRVVFLDRLRATPESARAAIPALAAALERAFGARYQVLPESDEPITLLASVEGAST